MPMEKYYVELKKRIVLALIIYWSKLLDNAKNRHYRREVCLNVE